MCLLISLWQSIEFFGEMPRNNISVLYNSSIYSCVKTFQGGFNSGCTNSHPANSVSSPHMLPFVFLMIVSLNLVIWNFKEVLICISQIIKNTSWSFRFFFQDLSVQNTNPIIYQQIFVYAHYILQVKNIFQIVSFSLKHNWQRFLSFYRLPTWWTVYFNVQNLLNLM